MEIIYIGLPGERSKFLTYESDTRTEIPDSIRRKVILAGKNHYFADLNTSDQKTLVTLKPQNLGYSEEIWVKDVYSNGLSTALLRSYVDWAAKKDVQVFTTNFAQNIITSFGYIGESTLSGYHLRRGISRINQDIIFSTIFSHYSSATNLSRFGLIGLWFKQSRIPIVWFGTVLHKYIYFCRRYSKE